MQMNANSNMQQHISPKNSGGDDQVALSLLHVALIIISSIITRLYCAQVSEASAGPRCKQQQEQRERQTHTLHRRARNTSVRRAVKAKTGRNKNNRCDDPSRPAADPRNVDEQLHPPPATLRSPAAASIDVTGQSWEVAPPPVVVFGLCRNSNPMQSN